GSGHRRARAPHGLRRHDLRHRHEADALLDARGRRPPGDARGPPARARGPAAQVGRPRHARRDRVPGEPQVRRLVLPLRAALLPPARPAQGPDPALPPRPPVESWPPHHGDYPGRRFSTLKQINTANVKNLTLAWIHRVNTSPSGAVVGGEGPETPPAGYNPN